jgi:hypothetical protein
VGADAHRVNDWAPPLLGAAPLRVVSGFPSYANLPGAVGGLQLAQTSAGSLPQSWSTPGEVEGDDAPHVSRRWQSFFDPLYATSAGQLILSRKIFDLDGLAQLDMAIGHFLPSHHAQPSLGGAELSGFQTEPGGGVGG